MALEGLAALGVASNVVQLVDFGTRLLTKSRALYRSADGLLVEDSELDTIASCLQRLSRSLINPHMHEKITSQDESDLVALATLCKGIADDLLNATEQLRIKDVHCKRQTFLVALKSIWKPDKIDDLRKRLDSASSQMTLSLLKMMNSEQADIKWAICSLGQGLGRIQSQDASNFQTLRSDIFTLSQNLRQQQKLVGVPKALNEEKGQIVMSDLEELSTKLKILVKAGERLTTQFRIIESLMYKRMQARNGKISEAHAKTFEWILDRRIRTVDMGAEDSFIEWLTSGSGNFWISGKAGSGKSTLMKFLTHHPAAKHALTRWADTKGLVTASFYFWYAGTELQKSQIGLLQSLLHTILNQCPDLVPTVVPERWEQCDRTGFSSQEWTKGELDGAFANLRDTPTLNNKFCFFIDGLDEYDGDHQDIIDLVQGLTQADNIKICISSRPWNLFELAFGKGQCPRLRLEHLTQNDMRCYVLDQLELNPLFRQHMATDQQRCEEFSRSIVGKAQGAECIVLGRIEVRGLRKDDGSS